MSAEVLAAFKMLMTRWDEVSEEDRVSRGWFIPSLYGGKAVDITWEMHKAFQRGWDLFQKSEVESFGRGSSCQQRVLHLGGMRSWRITKGIILNCIIDHLRALRAFHTHWISNWDSEIKPWGPVRVPFVITVWFFCKIQAPWVGTVQPIFGIHLGVQYPVNIGCINVSHHRF